MNKRSNVFLAESADLSEWKIELEIDISHYYLFLSLTISMMQLIKKNTLIFIYTALR